MGVLALVFGPRHVDGGGDDPGVLAAAVFAPTVDRGVTVTAARGADDGPLLLLALALAGAALVLAGRCSWRLATPTATGIAPDRGHRRPPRRGPPLLLV